MLAAKVAIGSHCQRPAVLVIQPARDGWNINAALDADRRKQMPQIMMCNSSDAEFLARRIDCLLRFADAKDLGGQRFLRTFSAHPREQFSSPRNHWHTQNRPVFSPGFSVTANDNLTRLEIQIAPLDPARLRFSCASHCQPFNEIRAILRAPRAAFPDGLNELQELAGARQGQLLRTDRHTLQLRCRIAVHHARLDGSVEDVPQTGDRVVVAGRGGNLSESSRPFIAIRFRDSAHFAIREPRPTFEQRRKDLIPVMAGARLDRYIIGLVLLVDFERLGECHFHRRLVAASNLLRAMIPQKFRKLRFSD